MNLGKSTEKIEYKRSTAELDEGIVSICSILNKHNQGVLYFGISNTGNIVGQEIGEDTLRKISHKIRNNIKPVPSFSINKLVGDFKNIIEIVFNGTNTP
jgi:ATP-dependent DNA helicase RecG